MNRCFEAGCDPGWRIGPGSAEGAVVFIFIPRLALPQLNHPSNWRFGYPGGDEKRPVDRGPSPKCAQAPALFGEVNSLLIPARLSMIDPRAYGPLMPGTLEARTSIRRNELREVYTGSKGPENREQSRPHMGHGVLKVETPRTRAAVVRILTI